MKTTFKDINGNLSSKRVTGMVAGGVVLVAFVMDGFSFFEMNEGVAETIIFCAAGLLGTTVFEKKH